MCGNPKSGRRGPWREPCSSRAAPSSTRSSRRPRIAPGPSWSTARAATARCWRRRCCGTSATKTSSRSTAASADGSERGATGGGRRAFPASSGPVTHVTSSSAVSVRRGNSNCSGPGCSCWAPAASAHPPRSISPRPESARSAWSITTTSRSPTCSARCSTTRPASAYPRSSRPGTHSEPSTRG